MKIKLWKPLNSNSLEKIARLKGVKYVAPQGCWDEGLLNISVEADCDMEELERKIAKIAGKDSR